MTKWIFLFFLASQAAFASPLKLALNWKAEPQFGGFYAAQLQKEFSKRHLDVEIMEGGSGTPTVQMLGSQQVDFAIVSAEEIILAREHGAKVVALYASYQTNPQAIMTHEAQGFHSLKDLFQSSTSTLALQKGLSYAQFLLKKYPSPKVQMVPYLGGISSFVKDPHFSQQCFVTSEPFLAEKAGQKVKLFLVSEEGFNPYTTVLAVNEDRLQKDPSVAKAMTEAVRAGWEFYLQQPETVNAEMSKKNPAMDLTSMKASAEAQKSLIQNSQGKLGEMTLQRWQQLVDQLKALGLTHHEISASDLFRNL